MLNTLHKKHYNICILIEKLKAAELACWLANKLTNLPINQQNKLI